MQPIPSTPQQLSDEQVKRLLIAIEGLKDHNTMAGVIWQAIEKQPDLDAKRRILVTGFSQAYELMVVMQMGINATLQADKFRKNLDKIKRKNHAGSN